MAGSTPPSVVFADPTVEALPGVEMEAIDAIDGVSDRCRFSVRGREGRGADSAGRFGVGCGFVRGLSPAWESGVGRIEVVAVAGEFVPLWEIGRAHV